MQLSRGFGDTVSASFLWQFFGGGFHPFRSENSATIQTFRLECLTGETSYRGGMDNVFLGELANNLPKKLQRLILHGFMYLMRKF